jgi:hypothetical protein
VTDESPDMDFRSAVSEIFWNWQLHSNMPHHQLERGVDQGEPYITVDKLTITPTWASYKMQNWKVLPGVFDKLTTFLDGLIPMLEPQEPYDPR